ncbi:hypothetical protein SAMN04487970_100469 [Paenibacillus tianmuensis]|uniref:Uncharacterized protein n=1 Tax=Paenibacillus tianmuensis TaxID=624147 RepID=A0A1G4PV88_9BACL|nr:hypothetical protein [Paenibacillus tianmuensis]SCW36137.1 hypothetical protein SAMN04487970_100469 [Paenibacillus tianmuensis]
MEIKPMIESIVRELVQAMQAEQMKKPKVLYLFCDSTAHEAFTDHFILLKNSGICYDLLFLDGETSAWLGLHKIESSGPGKIIAADEYAPAPLELPLEYDGIVIPEIDVDNAARAAQGLKGTVKAEILFSALVLNKFVLIGDDIPGLKRADRRTLKTLTLPKPYVKLFERYKRELAALGAEFAPQKLLAEAVVRKCGAAQRQTGNDASAKGSSLPEAASAHAGAANGRAAAAGSAVFEGKLLTAEWVKRQTDTAPDVRKLILSKGTIVSPLAADLLKEKDVTVQYADKG